MAKTTKKRSTKTNRARKTTSNDNMSLLSPNTSGPWGKDQPMILILSAGIIIMIVLTLFMTGWL